MGCCYGCCVKHTEAQQIAYLFGKLPVSKASNVAEDVAKFYVGRTLLMSANGTRQDPLKSPVSSTPCVYYEVLVEKLHMHFKEEQWLVVAHEYKAVDFYIADAESLPLFVPAGSKKSKFSIENVVYSGKGGGTFGSKLPSTPAFQALLNSNGVKSSGFLGTSIGSKVIRYRECVLPLGETVGVLGVAAPEVVSGAQLFMLRPCAESSLSDAYFRRHKWSCAETASWHALTAEKCFICSDSREFCIPTQPLPHDYARRAFGANPNINASASARTNNTENPVYIARQNQAPMPPPHAHPQAVLWQPTGSLVQVHAPPPPPPAYEDAPPPYQG
jgi:hypothetical protein